MANPYVKRPLRTAATVFDYAAPELVAYEDVAKKKLAQIIESLELGEDANLGTHRSSFKPDDSAEIEFNVSPGVLEPIIRVTIRFPNEKIGGGRVREESEAKRPGPVWLGVQMIGHQLDDLTAFNFGTMARVNGFEPEVDGTPLTFSQSVEPCPVPYQQSCGVPFGAYDNYVQEYGEQEVLSRTDEDSWVNSLNLESLNCQTGVTPNPDYVYDEPLRTCTGVDCPQYCSSNYNWQAQCLENNLVMCASKNGMVLLPAYLTPWFAPQQAYNGVGGGETLPRDYWGHSIIIDETNGVRWSQADGYPANITEHVRLLGELGVTYQNLRVEDFDIPCTVLGGEYVFHFWSEGYPCDEVAGTYHARLVIGGSSEKWQSEIDSETKADTGEVPRVLYGGGTQVVDIYPLGIGGLYPESRGLYCSDTTLGGDGWYAKNIPDHGYASIELRVNVKDGTWRIEPADYKQPFYCTTCTRPPPVIRTDPQGCGSTCEGTDVGDADYAELSSGREDGGWALPCLYGISGGVPSFADIRGFYMFQLARVLQVTTSDTQFGPAGAICFVQLVGIDGTPGSGLCSCKPYGYGGVFKAMAVDGSIGGFIRGTLPPPPIGGFQVGDVVGVIGVATPCNASDRTQPDTQLVVVRPTQPWWNFLGATAWQMACPDDTPVQNFIATVEGAAASQFPADETHPQAASFGLNFSCYGSPFMLRSSP